MTPVATEAYMQPMRARRPRAVLVREPSETQYMRYGFDGGCLAALSESGSSMEAVEKRKSESVPGSRVTREFPIDERGCTAIGEGHQEVGSLSCVWGNANWEDSSVSATLHDFINVSLCMGLFNKTSCPSG